MLVSKISGKPEIFYTFQGEGINIGKPVIFVRLATCNLHCHWCDTAYTWNWKKTPWKHDKNKKYDLKEQSINMSAAEVAEAMMDMSIKHSCNRFTITGGEPLLQQKMFLEVIEHFANPLQGEPFQFDFETNGTILPVDELLNRDNVYFNCSPKLAHSGNSKSLRYKPEVLKALMSIPRSSFKFVVNGPQDIREIKAIQKECGIPSERIYLMPQGITKKMVSEKESSLAEICKKNGYNLTTRLHVLVYGGAKRGV